MSSRPFFVFAALALSLALCDFASAQNGSTLPGDVNIPAMAAAARAFSGRNSRPGGVAGSAQAMAMRQAQMQQMAARQQMAAAQMAAAKKAEKKEKVRQAAEQLRDKKEARKEKLASAVDRDE